MPPGKHCVQTGNFQLQGEMQNWERVQRKQSKPLKVRVVKFQKKMVNEMKKEDFKCANCCSMGGS